MPYLRTSLFTAIACFLMLAPSAYAADLNGAWVSNENMCNKVFVKRGKTISFTKDADIHGSGFIIDGRNIRGKAARCTIKSTKEEGATVHLLTSCATDIMLSDVQFTLKVVDADRLVRLFPGMSDMQMEYYRCSM